MRRWVVSSLLVLIAIGWAALPTAFAAEPRCTYTFPPEGGHIGGDGFPDQVGYGSRADPVKDGDVVCGGPGDDSIFLMTGGTFYGNGGNDHVRNMAGTFYGGPGSDGVTRAGNTLVSINSGTFVGGPDADFVFWNIGTFIGGPGDDAAQNLVDGVFEGGAGTDRVGGFMGGTFEGGGGPDSVSRLTGPGTFRGGGGNDEVSEMLDIFSRFEGGGGDDAVDELRGGTFAAGGGDDAIRRCVTSPPAVYTSVESVPSQTC